MKYLVANKLLLFGTVAVVCFTSCREKTTSDPIESYKNWAGELPPKNVKVIHGKYWQSAHWSKEYILYLELQAPSSWIAQFIEQNSLVKAPDNPGFPSDAPGWFNPGKDFRILKQKGFDQGSVYYEDTLAGKVFIYEVQL